MDCVNFTSGYQEDQAVESAMKSVEKHENPPELLGIKIGDEMLSSNEVEFSSIETDGTLNLDPISQLELPMVSTTCQEMNGRSLTSTEIANALFSEFEEKLSNTLNYFNCDDQTEMQKTRNILRAKNAQIEERITGLERQLASASVANYLIKYALGPNDDDTDQKTVDAVRGQFQHEGNIEVSADIRGEVSPSKSSNPISGADETPTKIISKTLMRLVHSSIIKIPAECRGKKIKITREVIAENNERKEENVDNFEVPNNVLQEFLDQIIEIADEAIKDIEQNGSRGKKCNISRNAKKENAPSAKRKKSSITTPEKRLSTRAGSARSQEKLINPIKYHDCHLCKAGYYTEKDLHNHYVKVHPGNDERNGTFGMDQIDDQTNSTKCHLCGYVSRSEKDLHTHKSHHVKPEFCAHKCQTCDLKFCLKTELDIHRQICDSEGTD